MAENTVYELWWDDRHLEILTGEEETFDDIRKSVRRTLRAVIRRIDALEAAGLKIADNQGCHVVFTTTDAAVAERLGMHEMEYDEEDPNDPNFGDPLDEDAEGPGTFGFARALDDDENTGTFDEET